MSLPTYQGYSVLNWMPDWGIVTPDWQFNQKKNRWDNGIGRIQDDGLYSESPRTKRVIRYIIEGLQEIADARNFILNTAQGKLKPFWVPTWISDLSLLSKCESDANILVVRSFGYNPYLSGNQDGRKHVALYPWRASPLGILYRKIVSESVNVDGNTELVLDSDLGVDLEVDEMISWLMLCRVDSDDISVQWENRDLIVIELPIVDLAMETP